MGVRLSRDKWREICDGHAASGQSVERYAAQAGVNARTLQWWRGQLGMRNGRPGPKPGTRQAAFVEVVAGSRISGAAVTVRVGEIVIESTAWPSVAWLRELARSC